MNLFTRLPITLASRLYPAIPEADIDYFTDYEPSAYDHWTFNQGGAGGLVGRKAGKVLTVQSTTPSYSANYLTMTNSVGKGLLTDLMESSNASLTICAVVRDPTSGASVLKTPFGTLDTTAGGGTGGLPFIGGGGAARKVYTSYTGYTASVDTGQLAPDSQWLFLAVSMDFSSAARKLRVLVGGQAGYEVSKANAYRASVRALALGNGYYTGGTAVPLDFAEFVPFTRAMSLADMQAVYARCKARLAVGGIAVV